jgi:type IV secretory pathway VirB4 component
LIFQVWNIQIFSNSIEELNQKSSQIQALVDRRNLLLLRETTNLEACFWSRFPTYESNVVLPEPVPPMIIVLPKASLSAVS